MSKCDTCKHSTKHGGDGWSFCDGCVHDSDLKDRYSAATNADHIRAMTDEELASFLCSVGPDEMEEDLWLAGDIIPDYDQNKVEDWLKQPYKEDA